MISKKTVLIITGSIALLGAGSSSYYISNRNDKTEEAQSDTSTENRTDTSQFNKNAKTKSAQKPRPQPVKNTAEITKVWQDTDGSVVVQTKLTGSGFNKCKITFTKGSAKVEETADIIFQPEFSTCAGFAVASSRFSSSGDWRVALNVTKDDGSTITSQSESIGVNKR